MNKHMNVLSEINDFQLQRLGPIGNFKMDQKVIDLFCGHACPLYLYRPSLELIFKNYRGLIIK